MGGVMYRFLLRPRWIAGHVLLLVTVITFVNLGLWQLRRLDERRSDNATVAARIERPALPFDEVAAETTGDGDAVAFRPVVVTGTYDPDAQLLTAPRAIPGGPGQQVLTVLERTDGPDVLVDRGWVPFDRDLEAAPAPPAVPVTVRGFVRAREPGPAGQAPQVAQIVPAQIGDRLGRSLSPLYVQLAAQEPPAQAGEPRPTPLPEQTEGNHLSYALQWFSFAAIALVGYPLLVHRASRTGGGRGETMPRAPGRDDVDVTPVGSG